MNETNKKNKNTIRIPHGILEKVATSLNIKYATAKARWYRKDPITSREVLKELKELNQIRLENYETIKELQKPIY